jgi:hypothetical protein
MPLSSLLWGVLILGTPSSLGITLKMKIWHFGFKKKEKFKKLHHFLHEKSII